MSFIVENYEPIGDVLLNDVRIERKLMVGINLNVLLEQVRW